MDAIFLLRRLLRIFSLTEYAGAWSPLSVRDFSAATGFGCFVFQGNLLSCLRERAYDNKKGGPMPPSVLAAHCLRDEGKDIPGI